MLEYLGTTNDDDDFKGQSGQFSVQQTLLGEEVWDQLVAGLLSCTQMLHHLLYLRNEQGLTGDGQTGEFACACGQLN